ncbi:MAG: hypothetical protein IJN94_04685 [Clostridia bacterium]|nr:hypothetical protein [Clostridia bacterium]
MKTSKKVIALVLSVVMLVGCFSASAFAIDDAYTPSIVIPGIFQSETKYYEDGEATDLEAPFFMDSTIEIVGLALTEALMPLGDLIMSQEDKDNKAAQAVADVLGEALMEKSRCDENGQFVHDIRATKYNDCFADLSAHDQEYILDQIPLQNYIDIAGGENLYFFSYASLGNMIDTAQELYDFIQFVKEDSGSDKVNIVPISQGGSVANALMQIYADNERSVAEDINRIVYVVPALDGSTLIGEIYQYGLLDDEELYTTMLPSLLGEEDMISYLVNIILRIMPNANVNAILDTAVHTLIMDYTRYSTLMWGLCPSGNYEACREMYLTQPGLEAIVEQTDWFYNAQCNRYDNILNAIEDGVKVFDIVDYNVSLYQIVDSWDDVNADGIIQLDSTSMGAFSYGVDVQLGDDYVAAVSPNCADPENHDHTDPNGIVDACAGLLPDTTFYFYNQNHERTGSNDVIMKLVTELLVDESFVDVYSKADKFPQFNVGRNSKGLMRDVAEMKEYDTSDLTEEEKALLADAIAQAEAQLDQTNVDLDAFEEAKSNFYDVRDQILNRDAEPEIKENDAYMSFGDALKQIMQLLSEILYMYFGGLGFSEM